MHFSAEEVDIIIYSSKREFISSGYYVAVTKRKFVGLAFGLVISHSPDSHYQQPPAIRVARHSMNNVLLK
jgi:hypothetical protein